MTVSTTYEPVQYTGNGVTTAFAFPYIFYDDTDIIVTLTLISTGADTVQTNPTDYTISGGDGFTGTINFVAAPSALYRVTIERSIPYTQEDNYVEGQAFPANTIETAFDRGAIRDQQLSVGISRALSYPVTISGITDATLPPPQDGKALIFSGTAGAFAVGPDAADIASAQTYAADALASKNAAQSAQTAAESAAAGMKWRPSVKAATTAALPTNTYSNGTSGVGATLTATSNGALAAQDGVTLIAGDRILVKNQVATLQNGVYTVTQVGTAGTPYILTRATDADTWLELISQAVIIEEGTTLADTIWICTVNSGGVIGTTAVTWTQINVSFVLASQAEAEAGSDNTKYMSSLRTAQAITFQHPKATQAQMEAQTADKYVTADNQKWHPGMPKAWVKFAGATGTIAVSHGVTSVVRNSTGSYTITWSTAFSSADYAIVSNILGGSAKFCNPATQAAGNCTIGTFNTGGAFEDQTAVFVAAFGDQ